MPITMNLVDAIASTQAALLASMGRDCTYTLNDNTTSATVRAFIRGVRADDLFAAAQQQDQAAVLDAKQFAAAFSRLMPQRFDRLRTPSGRSFSVEEWRGAPNDDQPVFFKLLLRGGGQ